MNIEEVYEKYSHLGDFVKEVGKDHEKFGKEGNECFDLRQLMLYHCWIAIEKEVKSKK